MKNRPSLDVLPENIQMKKRPWYRDWPESILIAFIIAMIARTFIVQAFKIPTGSMEPTLHGDPSNGDRVLVNKFVYALHPPKRGDIVVFRTVNIRGLDYHKDYIKRLVGLPGDKIEIRHGHIYVNGERLQEPEIFNKIYYTNTEMRKEPLSDEGQYGLLDKPIRVPQNHYFVLGDNSSVSRDSRYWGFVPKENLIGQAFITYWPILRVSRDVVGKWEFEKLNINVKALWQDLIMRGYINQFGAIQEDFKHLKNVDAFELSASFEYQKQEIFKILKHYPMRVGLLRR